MKIIQVTVSKGRKIPGTGKDKYGNREYFVAAVAELEITDDIPKMVNELFKGCEEAINHEIRKDRYGDRSLPLEAKIRDELPESFAGEERDDDVLQLMMLPKNEALEVFRGAWKRARHDIQGDGTISYAAMWAAVHEDHGMKDAYFENCVFTLKELGVIIQPRNSYYKFADPEDGK